MLPAGDFGGGSERNKVLQAYMSVCAFYGVPGEMLSDHDPISTLDVLSSVVAKSFLNPATHRIFMRVKKLGDFFNRITSMNFYQSVVRMTFSHNSHPPHLR